MEKTIQATYKKILSLTITTARNHKERDRRLRYLMQVPAFEPRALATIFLLARQQHMALVLDGYLRHVSGMASERSGEMAWDREQSFVDIAGRAPLSAMDHIEGREIKLRKMMLDLFGALLF
jgi:hypothetical protein